MKTDVLILNTLVLDIRSADFGFADALVGPGGLAKCATADMPPYTQAQFDAWIAQGRSTAGGPGNTAPLLARAGLAVAVGGNLGAGAWGGLDRQGRAFCEALHAAGVDLSAMYVHPELPTGTTFIHEAGPRERGGIAYFPNANNDFDFARFRPHVERLAPTVVYYMYSGLSDRGDANGGCDLAAFAAWCRSRGSIVIADSHTLCSDPEALIASGAPVPAYGLLDPILPELDIFFTSWDEARLIRATLDRSRRRPVNGDAAIEEFLLWLFERFGGDRRPRLFGVTVRDGAFAAASDAAGRFHGPRRFTSRFMCGEIVDLVGAGDSFRAGLVAYVARHAPDFRSGRLPVEEAVQAGNLMASLFIKSPLDDRYGHIPPLDRLLDVVRGGKRFETFENLLEELAS